MHPIDDRIGKKLMRVMIMLHIDELKHENGFKFNDCFYENEIDLIHSGFLGLCGCGNPENNLLHIKELLKYVESKNTFPDYESWVNDGVLKFGSKNAIDFSLYTLDKHELIEHGGSVGGSWLSSNGKYLLEDLEKIDLT